MDDAVEMETVDTTLIKNRNEKGIFAKNINAIHKDKADAKETTSQMEEDGVSFKTFLVCKCYLLNLIYYAFNYNREFIS